MGCVFLRANSTGAQKPFSPMRRKLTNNDNFLGYLFLTPALLFLGLLIIYPVMSAIIQSFYNTNYISGSNSFIGLDNFISIVHDKIFWKALYVDVVWTVGSVGFQLLLGLLAASLISRESTVNKVIRSILLTPYVIPIISLALLFRWMLNDTYGIITSFLVRSNVLVQGGSLLANTKLALPTVIAVNILRSFPFCMVNYLGTIQSISQDPYEAAMIDGANAWQKFRFITLPHLKGITLSLLILRMIFEFNSFEMIYLLTEGGPAQATQHLPILIYTESIGLFNFGRASALSVVMGIILVMMITAFTRLFSRKGEVM